MWQVAWAHPMYESLLASASYDHRVIIWKESGGKWAKLSEQALHEASVNSVAWAPYQYGCILASASSDKSIAVLRFGADGAALPRRIAAAHEQGANAVSWAPATRPAALLADGAAAPGLPPLRLASAGNDNTVKLWRETPEGEWELERALEGHADWVRDVAWAPGLASPHPTIASCSQVPPHSPSLSPPLLSSAPLPPLQDKRVLIWRSVEGDAGSWSRTLLHTFPDVVWHVSWSLCGSILAVSSGDNKVHIPSRTPTPVLRCGRAVCAFDHPCEISRVRPLSLSESDCARARESEKLQKIPSPIGCSSWGRFEISATVLPLEL